MRFQLFQIAVALAFAGGLAGCAPGPGGYAGWSNYRQQQASQSAYNARRDQQAARWQAANGDYWGAQQSQAAANAEAAQAQRYQGRSDRDRFLSGF